MHPGRRRATGPSPADHEIKRISSNLTHDAQALGYAISDEAEQVEPDQDVS